MQKTLTLIICFLVMLFAGNGFAQDLKTSVGNNKELDSLRKREETQKDSVVFTSKYIRYTTLALNKDSIQTLPIDTGLVGIQNFSVLYQPRNPTIGLGVLGLAARPMLFEMPKTIGFDAGFHSLDYYLLNHEDVKYYRARSPYTHLYYVNSGDNEQVLKMTHSQNINKNWNFGATFNRIGANGFYTHQRGDDLTASIFTWYRSENKRYYLMSDVVFNTLKAQENGSILKDNIFEPGVEQLVDKQAEAVRLNSARQLYRKTSFLLKQSYFVGRIDSTGIKTDQNILPTNKITHTLVYTQSSFNFRKDEEDVYGVFPVAQTGTVNYSPVDAVFSNDSTSVKHLQNEFMYSFFLRAKSNVIKNELKLNVGLRHDLYSYKQLGLLNDNSEYYNYNTNFQNLSLLGDLGYRFSNKVDFNLNVQQIFQGKHIGDFLYEGKANVKLTEKTGLLVLSAYLQNKSPEQIFDRFYGTYYDWGTNGQSLNLDRTKVTNLAARYVNDFFGFDASAAYYLIGNYIYFGEGAVKNQIYPVQSSSDINLLKLTVGKHFNYKSWHFNAYVAYQKTGSEDVLRTPELYTFNSLYKDQTFFKTLKTQIGLDFRYNTPFNTVSYSPAASQFYNGKNVTFDSKPIVDVWVKAGLRRANIFAKYEYVNQGLLSNGFYTVNMYPMPDRLLKLGISWSFYD